MKDTFLLEAMAQCEKNDAQQVWADPRWEQFTLGQLSQEDIQALRVWALSDPQAQAAWDAFSPLSEKETAEIAHFIAKKTQVPLKKTWFDAIREKTNLLLWVPVCAGVASVGVLLWQQQHTAVLPGYTLAVSGYTHMQRSVADETSLPHRVTTGGVLSAVLRPDQKTDAHLQVKAWVVDEKGYARRVPFTHSVSEEGAVKMTLLGKDILGAESAPSVFELWLALAEETVKSPPEGVWDETSWRSAGWTVFHEKTLLEP